jgi:hypothetical protein
VATGCVGRLAAWLLAGAALALAGCGAGSGAGSATATARPGAATGRPGARSGAATGRPGARSGAATGRPGGQIPASLAAAARPIGAGPRFRPAARSGPVPGRCASPLGRRAGVHLELFAANRAVLLTPGIGVRRPWRVAGGRITRARCYGALATVDPTGVVLTRPGARLTVGDVFRAWGRPLRARRLLSFHPGGRVRAYVDGRRWTRTVPAAVPLTHHAEIVLELGPYVPPHRSFTFPAGE